MDVLTTEQVAERLGVKPATVYAYVSRGLLRSVRNGDGKASLFARSEVEAFEAGRKVRATPAIKTGITLISDGVLYYRGHDASELATTVTFESVVNLLWTGDLAFAALEPSPQLLSLARTVTAPLPPAARHTDRLRVIVAAAAAADPLRFDITPSAVVSTGRAMLATMVAALPHGFPATSLAAGLWRPLTGRRGTPGDHRLLDAALVLLADHDIAASTLAARVAASTRAHPYAVVGAGLAALDGPLHGAASGLAYELLADAATRRDPVDAVATRLRAGEPVPGFGHRFYPDGDPRAKLLLSLLGDSPAATNARRLAEAMHQRSGVHANIDLALAALALDRGMTQDAGETIFAIARTAGWLAHALEEYGDRPSRFRPSGRYAGLPPA
ncbi:citrate synthase [Paractinoplanes deccanensis]|uniref:citrate synthase (unknown stereospecificity) n=1 Tax=Paractinoplanes deccanensis TaxID=113561 RepID=A0ABQ3Y9V8_9ACTN|nr:citrate synthase [Actinoplanes deccanensis]GID76741.1 citrate synthase [Actinoplanes deccanensis]